MEGKKMRKQWITKQQALLILQLDKINTEKTPEEILSDLINDVSVLGADSVISWREDGVDLGCQKRGAVFNFFLRGLKTDGSDILGVLNEIIKLREECIGGCLHKEHRQFYEA